MNTPVSFPIAKLLKEKGFVFRQNETYYNPVNGFTKYENITPTFSEVIMWLYEKHKIWISVDPENDTNTWFHTITNGKSITVFGDYTSSTEAYEAGIEHILTDLI